MAFQLKEAQRVQLELKKRDARLKQDISDAAMMKCENTRNANFVAMAGELFKQVNCKKELACMKKDAIETKKADIMDSLQEETLTMAKAINDLEA